MVVGPGPNNIILLNKGDSSVKQALYIFKIGRQEASHCASGGDVDRVEVNTELTMDR